MGAAIAAGMGATEALVEWEMYGPGTALRFCGYRHDTGFLMTVRHDETTVFSDVAADAGTLLRKSTEMREQLQRLGYATRPLASALRGGVCWGPAAPLGSSLVAALR